MRGGARRVARRTARRTSRRQGMMGGGESESYDAAPTDADQLTELAHLRDEGVISEEEFEAKKRQILGI